jgi:hypothetical protein
MKVRSTHLLIPILALAFVAGCAAKGNFWPTEVIKPAGAAAVTRGDDTITIVANTEGNDGNPVSPIEWGYHAALLRGAREAKAAGFSRFEVIETDTYVISSIINHIGAPQRVRYTMTIRPIGPDKKVKASRNLYDTAEVLAGPKGGLL